MKIAIVGCGAVGSCAARFCAKAGHDVTVFEQYARGHSLGSSHGRSRIIRKTYPDSFYTKLMEDVYPLWEDLQLEAGEKLYEETGLLTVGEPHSEYFVQSLSSLRANSVRYELLGHLDIAKRFGGFHLDLEEEAIFQPEAGYLRVENVFEANLRIAESCGAQFLFNTRADNELLDKFDAVLISAGGWIKEFVDLPVKTTSQTFAYLDGKVSRDIPVWIDAGDDLFYGFPDYGYGFKIGRHAEGPTVEPGQALNAEPFALSRITEAGRKRLGSKQVLEAHGCMYTSTADEDFRIGELPGRKNAYYISACSGHGYKFSIWFGNLALRLIEGTASIADFPKFSENK